MCGDCLPAVFKHTPECCYTHLSSPVGEVPVWGASQPGCFVDTKTLQLIMVLIIKQDLKSQIENAVWRQWYKTVSQGMLKRVLASGTADF